MEPMNGIHNTGGNLRHDKLLHTLKRKNKTKQNRWLEQELPGKSMKLYEKLWMLIFRKG